MTASTGRPIFLLIDGHAVIYRAYYGLPKLSDPKGRVVNAVFGFTRILLSAINEFQPEYLALTFDHPTPTFRHKEFKEYKAQRPKMPDDLQPQIPLVKEVVTALNIPQFEQAGFEADDLIGTVSKILDHQPEKIGASANLLTIIVTGDKDMFQLVDENTHVWLPGRSRVKDREYDAAGVEEKMGVRPDQIVDLKALMGDSSDNIPGVRGIGPKTAVKLLNKFKTLDGVLAQVDKLVSGELDKDEIIKGSLFTKLKESRAEALLSQKLAQIETEVPLKINIEQCRVEAYDKTKAVELFKELDFRSLIKELPSDQFETEIQAALF